MAVVLANKHQQMYDARLNYVAQASVPRPIPERG